MSPSRVSQWELQAFLSLLSQSFREPISSMCWNVWPSTVWRRCHTLFCLNMLQVDIKRYSQYLFGHLLCLVFFPTSAGVKTIFLQVATPVVWNKPDIENSVPLWIIILAVLVGLLLLALLIYILYKVSTK